MKKIGIIAAMAEEMNEIKNIMTNIKQTQIYNLTFFEGNINNKECILVECGVGKVNAARVTQVLIDKFDIEYIINVGSAGAIAEGIDIGDIVIGEKLVQHDFDITAFGHPKGHISNLGVYIESDKNLIEKFVDLEKKIDDKEYKIKVGTIASGDIFCTEEKMKNKVRNKFMADAIEMEGAAIAQVSYLSNIPFVIIRSISDIPNGNNNITFDEFLKFASKRCADMLQKII